MQGLNPSLILCNIFMSGLMIEYCMKFANDTKLGRRARLELKEILPSWKYIMETK